MKLVLDANVLFSFFKKESIVRELILDPELKYNLELFTPDYVLEELGRHKDEICSKFSITPADFDIMLFSLEIFVRVVPEAVFNDFLPAAEEILSAHKKDVHYAALSLYFKSKGYEVVLWTQEKKLKDLEEHGIRVLSISELLENLQNRNGKR